jgi:hypothetical protein
MDEYKAVEACRAPGFSFQLNCLLLAGQENRRCHDNRKFSIAAKTVGLYAQKPPFTVLSCNYFHEIRRCKYWLSALVISLRVGVLLAVHRSISVQ